MGIHLRNVSTVNERANEAGPTVSDVDVKFRTGQVNSDLSVNTASYDAGCATHRNIECWATR